MKKAHALWQTPRTGLCTLVAVTALTVLGACAQTSRLPENAGYGPDPQLPEPQRALIPTVNVAEAVGWPEGAAPLPAQGLQVSRYASGLDHPRWLYVLPNGDVLVAETNAPKRPAEDEKFKLKIMGHFMKKAGAGTPSADRITLLRDQDGDGHAEIKQPFLEKLTSPFGMALVKNHLYVANTDGVVRFPYTEGDTRIDAAGEKVTDLPAGPLNHHWTKNIVASSNGQRLYATVGSNSNVGENGLDQEEGRAAIWEIDLPGGEKRLFATGLRNPNGMDWERESNELWTVVNERDELGSDLVPDYLTSVKKGVFYGWPYSYYGNIVDTRVQPQRPDLVAKAIKPDYALGAHTASLGLAFYNAELFPERYRGGAFIGMHGSWNREPPSGYKVVFVPFKDGKPNGMPQDILTGFLNGEGKAQGRPVGVAIDNRGALLVADDVGNVIWRVAPEQ
ncbi:sorbosone dehydrogenase family protein [Candidimonas sp. SYP-B2681]|uniref:PQQ-dependent sugar dehydrogenase n=1 Tax=Candidimonas sp. SYP-B2681 TaxID=2497686 RepID=UPI000F875F1F|nr:sorbosone dehydrogenase family protein [Candidimonas sp. SYP-B2681]RTZ40014.1 sorbosone dehydrogenase family protein [Candidimonas sp. SYP-B2681]